MASSALPPRRHWPLHGDMALQNVDENTEVEYHSLSGHEPEDGEDDVESETMEPPVHPVASMQAAFEESIAEAADDGENSNLNSNRDADGRRQEVLEAAHYDDSWTARWGQKPTAQFHPLLKLMAQIVFGMHLLQQQQAKSEEEVVKILQTHVNEVDNFLERTSEDFKLAVKDIDERVRFLKLPMVHQDVFEMMLDDKKFRSQLLDGNEKIEMIIERTVRAANAALLDVQKGMQANKELGRYLDKVRDQWPKERRKIADVYGAMRGNYEGWRQYLKDLIAKGNDLGRHLTKLGTLIADMSKMAAAASRRNKRQSRMATSGSRSEPSSPGLRSKFSHDPSPPLPSPPSSSYSPSTNLNKPLPREPNLVGGAKQPSIEKVHPVPFAKRFEQPRQPPSSPHMNSSKSTTVASGTPPRPRTAGGLAAREARTADTRGATSDLADFLKQSSPHEDSLRGNSPLNPLRSNPPDGMNSTSSDFGVDRKLGRSQSQGANFLLGPAPSGRDSKPGVPRSRSQGAMDILKVADEARAQPSKLRKSDSLKAAGGQKDNKESTHRYAGFFLVMTDFY